MKKIMAICLMTAMLVALSVNAFAAPNGFVSSPSSNTAPTVVSFDPADEECEGVLVISPYAERDELPEPLRALLEKAYNDIMTAEDLTALNEELAKAIAGKNMDGKNLAVSDLFDIHVTGCDFHDGHTDFDVTLDADTLSHFVALLHMNKDGKWELIKDAKVVNNGEHLQFSVESFSPFAIVVATDVEEDEPTDWTWLYIVIALIVVAVVVVIIIKSKKKKA